MAIRKFIQDELAMSGWKTQNDDQWVKEGVAIHIVPAKLNRMYYLSTTKMSETTDSFVSELELLTLINR